VTVHEAGEHVAAWAERQPDKPALVMHGSGEVRTYRQIDDSARRIARVLRDRGAATGGHLAVLVDNQPEFYDAVWAAMYTGQYVTPINWHLTADEAGYIVGDCDAQALVATARLAGVLAAMSDEHLGQVRTRISVDGDIPGFDRLDDLLEGVEPGPVPDEHEGGWMFYSSGTTGRPKGILPPLGPAPLGHPSFLTQMLGTLFGFTDEVVYLSPAPLYHAAPAGWTIGTQRLGGTAVVMERFDPLAFLEAIERHRITHVQCVPTHFVRLLKLTDEERGRYDLSSLQKVFHAAAPCPVEVKHRMIEWLGPIVHEFYSGSEGAGFCYIQPDEWLAHPGSVGKSLMGAIHVLDDHGEELPVGEEGEIWFETNRPFEYHRDPEKTKAVWDPRGWSWLGDVGRVDEDGYLFLTDRASHMIISGGVNIYPREVEDVLTMHPAIEDVGVLGTPDPEMGERVTAFVQLLPGASATEEELIAYTRERLSHFKCPREVRFVASLPRLPTGKLLKRQILS
jgi:long-chain acyl-CoA synthetase